METKIPDVSGALLRETHGPSRVELKWTNCHFLGSVKTVFWITSNKRRYRLYFGLSYETLGLDNFAAFKIFCYFSKPFGGWGGTGNFDLQGDVQIGIVNRFLFR